MTARVPAAAFEALHLDVALVVLAAERLLPFGRVFIVVVGMFCAVMVVVMWSICRDRVAFAEVEWDMSMGIAIGRGRVWRRSVHLGEERLSRRGRKGAVV